MTTVLLEKRDATALITLNRPEAMNAISKALRKDFIAAFENCIEDTSIRVVVITGNGKAFSAGFDLKELSEASPSADSDAYKQNSNDTAADKVTNDMARVIERFKGPVIAAVNGHAVTGGFELALACDVIVASENARFADTHARVGILAGWGLSQRLPRLIGISRAKELSFTGNPLFADKAYEWGLVNHVVPADELVDFALAMAKDMSACVPHVLEQYKTLIDDGFSMHFNEAMEYEERTAIESAKQASAHMIAARRKKVIERGREQKD